MHQIPARSLNNRHQNRCQEQDDHRAFQQTAHEDDEGDQQNHQQRGVVGDADEEFGSTLRHGFQRDDVADHRGEHDDQHDHADILDAVTQRLDHLGHGQLAEHQRADEDGVGNGKSPGFRWGEDAVTDTDDQENREDQRPFAFPGRRQDFAHRRTAFEFRLVAAPFSDDVGGGHQENGHQNARHDTTGKEAADRDVAQVAVDDQTDARRDGRGNQRADRHGCTGVALGQAGFNHRRAEHTCLHRRIGDGRAGNAAHQRREHDCHVGEAAADPAGHHR